MVPLVLVRDAAEDEQEDALEKQGQEVSPKATAETVRREHGVTRDARPAGCVDGGAKLAR